MGGTQLSRACQDVLQRREYQALAEGEVLPTVGCFGKLQTRMVIHAVCPD